MPVFFGSKKRETGGGPGCTIFVQVGLFDTGGASLFVFSIFKTGMAGGW